MCFLVMYSKRAATVSPWRHSGEERGGGHVREYLLRNLDNRVTHFPFLQ